MIKQTVYTQDILVYILGLHFVLVAVLAVVDGNDDGNDDDNDNDIVPGSSKLIIIQYFSFPI
jgi:hypothetical protein